MEAHIPIAVLRGTPGERGQQHGTIFRAKVQSAIDQSRASRGLDRYRRALADASAYLERIQQVAPELAEEIFGIAEGAQVEPSTIVLRTAFELFHREKQGCSGIAYAANSGSIVAQNWDAPPDHWSALVCLIHINPPAPSLLMISSAGGLGWVGMNDRGLSLCNMDLMLGAAKDGVPSQIVRRIALRYANVQDAADAMSHMRHMGGRAYLLGDARGDIMTVEASASGVRTLKRKGHYLVHANHALDPEIAALEVNGELNDAYPSSLARQEHLSNLAAAAPLTIDRVTTLLRDHQGHPDSICKHVSPREGTSTCFSVVFDCGAKLAMIASGNPCSNDYHTADLGTLSCS